MAAHQDGDAWLFTELHRNLLCYDAPAGQWYLFGPHHWAKDIKNEHIARTKEVTEAYSAEGQRFAWLKFKELKGGSFEKSKEYEAKEKAFFDRAQKNQYLRYKKQIVELAATGGESLAMTGEWDQSPYLLGVRNGTIDLREKSFFPGRPEDFIKTPAPTVFTDFDEPSPAFDKFMLDTFDGNTELIEYLARFLGCSLIGAVLSMSIGIFTGVGRNGKSTLLKL